jgi:hypothetical protein
VSDCSRCDGTGHVPDEDHGSPICPDCDGAGVVYDHSAKPSNVIDLAPMTHEERAEATKRAAFKPRSGKLLTLGEIADLLVASLDAYQARTAGAAKGGE